MLPPEAISLILVPGYLCDVELPGVELFGCSLPALREEGYRIITLDVTGGGSSGQNAKIVADAVRRHGVPRGSKLVLLGYSKGVADILRFLADYPAEAKRVDAILSVAGAVNGSPIAEAVPDLLPQAFLKLCGGDVGDGGGLDSIRRTSQFPWLCAHPPPSRIRAFSLVAFASPDRVSMALKSSYNTLAEVDPLNDSQLIFFDQVVPGSTLLGYVNADHWAVALPFAEQAPALAATFLDQNEFPRRAMLKAALRYIQEALAE